MAKQTYTTGQVLTAAQMTTLQTNDFNQTVSAKTASYTLVAADAGTRITMSNASATTVTVNTNLFTAGDTLQITNIGAGVCTITAGTATVSTAGVLTLAQNASGTLYFTSTGVSIFDGSAAANIASFNSGYAIVTTQESTTSATYTDLTTVGPSVTVTTGTKALVIISGANQNGALVAAGFMSYAISGATTVAASDNFGIASFLNSAINAQDRKSAARIVTGLTAGSNTFTAKYRSGTGLIYYSLRDITVIDMGS